jgi:hypothetical protein
LLSRGGHHDGDVKDLPESRVCDHRVTVQGGVEVPGQAEETLLDVENQEQLLFLLAMRREMMLFESASGVSVGVLASRPTLGCSTTTSVLCSFFMLMFRRNYSQSRSCRSARKGKLFRISSRDLLPKSSNMRLLTIPECHSSQGKSRQQRLHRQLHLEFVMIVLLNRY